MLDTKSFVSVRLGLSSQCVRFQFEPEVLFDKSILINPTYFAVVHIMLCSSSTELDSFQMKLSQKMCSKNSSNVHLLQSVRQD